MSSYREDLNCHYEADSLVGRLKAAIKQVEKVIMNWMKCCKAKPVGMWKLSE